MIPNLSTHKVSLLYPTSKPPFKKRNDDAGFDLTTHSVSFNPEKNQITFGFGIAVEPQPRFFFDLRPRSSLSKTPFRLANSVGTLDNPYRGEILAVVDVLMNLHDEKSSSVYSNLHNPNLLSVINTLYSDRLFQLVEQHYRPTATFTVVPKSELSETERGSGGFGSTN